MVDEAGLEPALLSEPEPKSGVSANFTTRPKESYLRRPAQNSAISDAPYSISSMLQA